MIKRSFKTETPVFTEKFQKLCICLWNNVIFNIPLRKKSHIMFICIANSFCVPGCVS